VQPQSGDGSLFDHDDLALSDRNTRVENVGGYDTSSFKQKPTNAKTYYTPSRSGIGDVKHDDNGTSTGGYDEPSDKPRDTSFRFKSSDSLPKGKSASKASNRSQLDASGVEAHVGGFTQLALACVEFVVLCRVPSAG
jgi:hypothetical protein